jgi:hypothetical protein
MKHDTVESSIPKEVITYAAGKVEAGISEIARNTNQPEQELREWVAIFLLSSWTGISNNLPTLRGKATKLYPTTRKMAMANNSHPESQEKPSDSSHPITSGKKGFKYNGTHWMQQPKNKARVRKMMKERHALMMAARAAKQKAA